MGGQKDRMEKRKTWWSDDQATDGESHSSLEQWEPTKSSRQSLQSEETKRMEKAKIAHESGCVTSDRKDIMATKRAKDTQKREQYLLHNAEEIKSNMKADKVVTVDLIDSIKNWKHSCDELEILAEQKGLQEEMAHRYFKKHPEVREPTDKKFETMTAKVWKLTQSSDTKCTNMVQDWESLFCFMKDHAPGPFVVRNETVQGQALVCLDRSVRPGKG